MLRFFSYFLVCTSGITQLSGYSYGFFGKEMLVWFWLISIFPLFIETIAMCYSKMFELKIRRWEEIPMYISLNLYLNHIKNAIKTQNSLKTNRLHRFWSLTTWRNHWSLGNPSPNRGTETNRAKTEAEHGKNSRDHSWCPKIGKILETGKTCSITSKPLGK